MTDWTPSSWKTKPVTQQPVYPSQAELEQVLSELAKFPPLVTAWEIEALKAKLAKAVEGTSFLLHGGDCAESFADCTTASITNKLKILLQMSLVLVHGLNSRVIRIGRIAGQYAKPRSADTETIDGVTLPSYRGDLINRIGFTKEDRTPAPELLLRGYERAAMTLNCIRSLAEGGFADLHHPENWDLEFMDVAPAASNYRRVVKDIGKSLHFMEAILGAQASEIRRIDFYTSHEALHLHYEQAQTKKLAGTGNWYDLTTHFPWIGARTSDLDSAHLEYVRGISNPVGVKISTEMTADRLEHLVDLLNPKNIPGRLTLIHRFGAEKIDDCLPPLIERLGKSGRKILWVSDPMHGNTETTSEGYKTRNFEHILTELRKAFALHRENGSRLGGVHFELTGENVTECIGGARGLAEKDLKKDYRSQVDPRLNYEQAMEMAMLVVEMERGRRDGG